MKKNLIAKITTLSLVCVLGVGSVTALALTEGTATKNRILKTNFVNKDNLTDEQKAEFEAKRAEQDAKHDTFYNSLTTEQKALYDAMKPAKPAEGVERTKPTQEQMDAMKQNKDAFINSLTESQKTEFDSLFERKERAPLTDEQKAELEAKRAEEQAKIDTFYNALTEEQKSLFDASRPAKPADGEKPARPTQEQMDAMKQNRDKFIASLSEAQKTEFESLFKRDTFKKDFDGKFNREDKANFNQVN